MKRVVRTFLKTSEGKYILVKHHKKGNWVLPGGHIEKGETLYKALKREIKEELGVEIKILGNKIGLIDTEFLKEKPLPICIYKLEYINRMGKKTEKMEYVFLSKVESSELSKLKIQKDEISECKCFTKEELISDSSVYNQTKEILKLIL